MEAEELSRLESYYSPGHLDYLLGRIEHVEAENVPGTVREELRARRRVRPGAASLRDALEQLREAESLWERMAGEAAQERPAQLLNLLDSGRALIAQIRALRRGARLRGRPRGPGGGRRRGGSRSPVKGGTAGRTWPRRWPGSRGGGSGDEEEGAAVPQPPSPVLPLETPPGSFCALVQGGRVADGPISLPDGRLSCRQVSQAIGCCLCRDAPSAASEPPHTVPSYSSQVQPYFYFEDEEENCCLLVQHHGNKLQLPALSEGIWKKFELLSEPGFSPSILSIAEQLEVEMVLGSNMFNQSFICDLDDNTSLQSTILQDCMWNGVSIATELQAASQEVNHKELLKEVSLEELLEEVS